MYHFVTKELSTRYATRRDATGTRLKLCFSGSVRSEKSQTAPRSRYSECVIGENFPSKTYDVDYGECHLSPIAHSEFLNGYVNKRLLLTICAAFALWSVFVNDNLLCPGRRFVRTIGWRYTTCTRTGRRKLWGGTAA